jgi:uncharacterized membrane protein
MEKKWVKYGVVGSVLWIAVIFLLSGDGLGILGTSRWDSKGFGSYFGSVIVGWIVIWVVCYFFVRGKEDKED